MNSSKIIILALATLLFTGAAATASPDGLYMEPLEVSPENPVEGDSVKVRATAYSPFSFEYMEFHVNDERKKRALCSNSLAFPTGFFGLPYGCSHTFDFKPNSAGEYDLKVVAASPFGTSKRTSSLTVEEKPENENLPPRINSIEFSPSQPLPGEKVGINVLASDVSNTGLLGMDSISVKAGGENIGSAVCGIFDSTCEKRFSFTPDSSGSVNIHVTALGSDGQSTTRDKTLYVREELSSSGVTGTVSNPVTLYVEMTDGIDASEYECYWAEDDSVSESDNELDRDGNRFEAEEEFDGGDHEVYMSCFRNGVSTNTVSSSFSIEENEEPTADLEISPENAKIGENIEFDASDSEDEDGEINRYRWDFDNDGDYDRTTEKDTTKKSFSKKFDGKAKVEVRDDDGATDTATASYTVKKKSDSCRIKTSGVKLSDNSVSSGDEVDVWLNVSNNGNRSQKVTTAFSEGGDKFYNKTRSIQDKNSFNFSTTFEASETITIKSTVVTSGKPCGKKKYEDSKELEVTVEGITADFSYEPRKPEVDERVRFDATETVSENDIESYRWDFDDGNSKLGEEVTHRFDEEDNYRVELEVEDDEGNTDTKRRTVEVGDVSSNGELRVNVEDEDGEELRDARVRVRNGDSESDRTDSDGEVRFNLEEDEYEVEVSKSGYRTQTKTVEIEEEETETVDFELRRDEESELTVEVTDGFSALDGARVEADGETEFTDRGKAEFELDSGDYTVTASLNGYRTVSKFISVEESSTRTLRIELEKIPESEQKSVSLQLDRSRISYGESVMVKGFVDNTDGRSNVQITRGEEELGTVSTQPDGYFQAFVTPEKVGKYNLEVSAGSASSSTPLEVQPTVSVSEMTAPRKVFEGSKFEICANVESQVTPTVKLSRNGEHLSTSLKRGRNCFSTTASGLGETRYSVTAEVSGDSDTVSRNVKVLELDEEVTSFPSSIAAVETESGMIKLDLYNTHDELKRYSLDIYGIEDSWVSQSKQQVILDKGERETVYFYITGRDEGSFSPTIAVSSEGTTVFSEQVDIKIGGTKTPQKKGVLERLQGLLPF